MPTGAINANKSIFLISNAVPVFYCNFRAPTASATIVSAKRVMSTVRAMDTREEATVSECKRITLYQENCAINP